MQLEDRQRYGELQRMAADFIEDYGITSFPIDPFTLLNKMGIPAVSYDSIQDGEIRVLAEKASKDAFLLVPDDYDLRKIRVCFNSNGSPGRIKTDIMHEISHLICGHMEDFDPFESEAKYLASYLLAPTPVVIETVPLISFQVQEVFDVSFECARIRVDNANARLAHGAPWYEHELRILAACKDWIEAVKRVQREGAMGMG